MDIGTRISIISSSGSSTNSGDSSHDFSGQELLLLRQLEVNRCLLESWKESLSNTSRITEDDVCPLGVCALLYSINNE